MSAKKSVTHGTLIDPDDAPELTDAWFQRADLHEGGKLLRRGRPPAEVTKTPIKLRLDPDIIAAFKASGRGWQTRMNDALRDWLKLHSAA
ncbi:MAG: BrnA antitoxin family protein [Sulfuritalea sp.]|nr:BrnA antitoxin family protein [Sulfuritalea sp.]MDP1982816.1 BrnA antitoxin family protein [Sulfuritalea sp.]